MSHLIGSREVTPKKKNNYKESADLLPASAVWERELRAEVLACMGAATNEREPERVKAAVWEEAGDVVALGASVGAALTKERLVATNVSVISVETSVKCQAVSSSRACGARSTGFGYHQRR